MMIGGHWAEFIICQIHMCNIGLVDSVTSGQSYKASTIVIYDSRVVPDLKIPHITTLES